MTDWKWDSDRNQWDGGPFRIVNIADEPIRRHCGCTALNHPLHKPSQCDEPGQPTGEGTCYTCRMAKSPPKDLPPDPADERMRSEDRELPATSTEDVP